MSSVSGVSGAKPEVMEFKLKEFQKGVKFGSYHVKEHPCASSMVPGKEVQAKNQLTPRRFELHQGKAFQPGDVQSRIEYLNQLPAPGALINNPEVNSLLHNYSSDLSEESRKEVLKMLADLVEKKQSFPDLRAGIEVVGSVKPDFIRNALEQLGAAHEAYKEIIGFLRHGDLSDTISIVAKNKPPSTDIDIKIENVEELRKLVGASEALLYLCHDIVDLLRGKLPEGADGSLCVIRYFNLFDNSNGQYEVMEYKPKKSDYVDNKTYGYSEIVSVGCIVDIMINRLLQPLMSITSQLTRYKNDVYISISSSGAKSLKNYLENWSVSRLFMPMAGVGYFASQLKKVGIKATCFDYHPNGKCHHQVISLDARAAVKKFAELLQRINLDIRETSLVLDAPPPVMHDPEKGPNSISANHYLPELVSCWYKNGGRKLVVISEAAREELLFDPDRMKELGVQLKPAEPFPAGICEGLGVYIGVCGAYNVEGIS